LALPNEWECAEARVAELADLLILALPFELLPALDRIPLMVCK